MQLQPLGELRGGGQPSDLAPANSDSILSMQISAGQDGIQRLLAAEKEAQQIVANARKGATLTPSHLSPGFDRISAGHQQFIATKLMGA